MNKKNLSMANEKADEEPHIHNNQHLNKDKTRWIKWGIAAVCVLLLSSAVIIAYANHRERTNTDKSSSVPGIIVDGVTYLKSGWETDAEQCPDGFEYGGIVDQVNQNGTYLLNSKYYVSSKISEWVYVYCWVSENPAETGEENSSMAYVRFVRAVERYKTFLFYDGQLYQSLWDYCAVANDEKTAYNNSRELEKRYGLRIEVLPESCVLAGSAHLEELDRIPQTEMGINNSKYDEATVYVDPSDKEVLYIGISWHTASDEENGETLHNGYDVFVLYNPSDYQS